MLKAVAFDLWETLLTNSAELGREQERLRLERMEQVLAARGFRDVAHRLQEAHRSLWTRCQELYWSEDVDISCRRQIEHFLEELGLDPHTFDGEAIDELEHAYAHAAVELPPVLVEGARETLDALRERGLRLGLISNTGRTPGYALRKILDNLGVRVDVMVFSNEHGACKPQRSIFEELREGLGVAFEEMAFVGDNLYVDVHGAQRCGMRGILFDPPVRGVAVAPPVEHGLTITPDARITRLRELVGIVAG
jgi:putative hydrolase of the HAD superfamily